jgi:hypothetical protein
VGTTYEKNKKKAVGERQQRKKRLRAERLKRGHFIGQIDSDSTREVHAEYLLKVLTA